MESLVHDARSAQLRGGIAHEDLDRRIDALLVEAATDGVLRAFEWLHLGTVDRGIRVSRRGVLQARRGDQG